MNNNKKPELLLPVGQLEMALAAIHHGADAIFVGVPGFNARGRSYDFQLTELEQIIQTCHLYGVKVNLALNILIFESEMPQVLKLLESVIPLCPDALIVQDLGLVNLIRKISPLQPIHASTQMTITNDLAINFLKDLKIKRFVLGRENSLLEIEKIRSQVHEELEVFVHGALCVSYSGQCFTSESIGGRSANRGQCAQSCRFSYDLIVDGSKRDTQSRNFLVSPQDLCGIEQVPQLIEAGVNCFKIEGRLKTPEYVAASAQSYRLAIDTYCDQNRGLSSLQIEQVKFNMAAQYSRGFFSGWLNGVNHQKLVDGHYSAHRGAFIGLISDYKKGQIVVELDTAISRDYNFKLEPGDGILWALSDDLVRESKNRSGLRSVPSSEAGFEQSYEQTGKHDRTGKYEQTGKSEQGSFIFSVHRGQGNQFLEIGISNDVHLNSSVLGARVYVNHLKDYKNKIHQKINDKQLVKKIPVSYRVQLQLNAPMRVCLSDGQQELSLHSSVPLSLAQNKALTEEVICDELFALSGTVFKAEKIEFEWLGTEPLFIPLKEIKKLRQSLTLELENVRKKKTIDGFVAEVLPLREQETLRKSENSKTDFIILLRKKQQVDDLILGIQQGRLRSDLIESVVLDFEFGLDYASSIEKLKVNAIRVGLATTRILKPQEYGNLKILKKLNPDFILVRNLGAIEYFQTIDVFAGTLRGDFSLNASNHWTSDYLIERGLESVCLSYDLNKTQVEDLIRASSYKSHLEVTLHQVMPSFHMEHCVFAAFLSQGSSFRDCGKPCEKHHVELQDQFGNCHWIKADQECRNTMFNAKAQTAISCWPLWKDAGLERVRYEALHEVGEELVSKIEYYQKYFSGKLSLSETLSSLRTLESYGLSSGSLAYRTEHQARKKDHHFQQ